MCLVCRCWNILHQRGLVRNVPGWEVVIAAFSGAVWFSNAPDLKYTYRQITEIFAGMRFDPPGEPQ